MRREGHHLAVVLGALPLAVARADVTTSVAFR